MSRFFSALLVVVLSTMAALAHDAGTELAFHGGGGLFFHRSTDTNLGTGLGGGGGGGGGTAFTALHTYFISPTGNDSWDGSVASFTSASHGPWLTPNHAVQCGDVVLAVPGAYSSANFDTYTNGSQLWGTVSNCPSASGGLSGTTAGGINLAVLMCETFQGCTINATTQFGMYVSASNWAIEGFFVTDAYNDLGGCFYAGPATNSSPTIGYVAFINDVASGCALDGFQAGSKIGGGTTANAVDEVAYVGDIAYNAAWSSSYCGSGFDVIDSASYDAASGTHIYLGQLFGWGNINGACSPNSNFVGAYATTSGAASAGNSSFSVTATPTQWAVGWPLQAQGAGGVISPAIATSGTSVTLVSSVTGTTIGINHPLVAPGLSSGQNIAVGTTTDGEGINFDTMGQNSYAGPIVVENVAMWGNGNSGIEYFCGGGLHCPAGLSLTIRNTTLAANIRDPKHDGAASGLFFNVPGDTQTGIAVTNNIVWQDLATPYNSTTYAAWDSGTKTGVGHDGTGQPVMGASFGFLGATITGNYIFGSGLTCPTYGSCDSSFSVANYNGANYNSTNTLGVSPGFAAPGSLPTGAPSCGSYTNVVQCMNAGYSVSANLAPSGGAIGKGYQAPGPCAANSLYPTWLKGVVYLSWDGSNLTEADGLITKPCSM